MISRIKESEKISEEVIKRTIRDYRLAMKEIEKEIEGLYNKIPTELLTKAETKEFYTLLKSKSRDNIYLERLLNHYGGVKARITRLEALQLNVYSKVKDLANLDRTRLDDHLKEVLSNAYNKDIYLAQKRTGLNFSFGQLSNTKLQALLKERWSGRNYSARIWTNTDTLADKLQTTITKGFLTGKSSQVLAREIRQDFKVGTYNATRLIRTETNYFTNQGEFLAYEEMGVDYYTYIATLDNRTSDICGELDGKRFKLKEAEAGVNYPPMHPNCRSTTIADDLPLSKLERRAKDKDGNTIKVPATMSYKEWGEMILESN